MHNLFGTLLFTLTFVYCLPFVDEIENDESTSNLFTLYTHDIHLIQTFSHVVENITRQYGKARDIDPFLFSINQSSCPNYDPSKSCLIHLLPLEHDRSCLIKPPHPPTRGKSFFQGVFDEDNIYKFITTAIGISLEAQKLSTSKYKLISPHHQCDRIKLSELTMEDMVSKYWLPQKPLIIENFLNPLNSTDIEAILRMNGNIRVGAKLSYSGEFEGIDDIQNWKSSIQNIPLSILQQLESPDLVVVRPAHKEITIQNFLENLRSKSATQANSDFEYQFPSIYIEYLPIQENKELLFLTNQLLGQPPHSTDLLVSLGSKFPFLKYLANGNAYLWIGDGATIGKLHFDPFENLLIQVEGSKTFIVVDPSNNTRFYEGYMREALIEAEEERTSNKTTGRYRFNKRLLLESTSLVHSPIDITLQSLPFSCDDELDLCVKSKNSLQIRKLKQIQRYPKSQDIFTMSCKVNKGEAIWIPSFWWHEVTSIPGSRNPEVPLNVAVNLWFDPLFRKEFPCKSCTQRRINQVYTSLIRQLVRNHVIK